MGFFIVKVEPAPVFRMWFVFALILQNVLIYRIKPVIFYITEKCLA